MQYNLNNQFAIQFILMEHTQCQFSAHFIHHHVHKILEPNSRRSVCTAPKIFTLHTTFTCKINIPDRPLIRRQNGFVHEDPAQAELVVQLLAAVQFPAQRLSLRKY